MRKTNFFHLKSGILLLLFIFLSFNTYAIRAYRELINVNQPDGSTLTIQTHGDEFFKYRTTADGYLVTENEKGYYVYANVDNQGKITPSSRVAKNQGQRNREDTPFLMKMPKNIIANAPRAFIKTVSKINAQKTQKVTPYIGAKKGLVILVNFSDKAFTVSTPQTSFTNLLNQTGYSTNGGTGSAKDYFLASTYGEFIPEFDVVGPYNLPQNMSYYGKNDSYGDDQNPVQMVVDACTLANNAGVDFTQYDTDNDGYVDNVFVYYAGYNEAEGASSITIWPHRWGVYPTATYGTTNGNYTGTVASITFDGKIIMDYACTSELKGTSGTNMCGIGTFCHEFGHVLGLPDYYDTSGTQANTLDDWNIMDYGAYNNSGRTPPVYSAYDRFFLGYLTPTQLSSPANVVLNPISQATNTPSNFDNQSVLLSASTHNMNGSSPSPTEFWVLEYRKQTGWDAYLPAEGLLIWHIDYNATNWSDNDLNNYTGTSQTYSSHMRVYLQPLSGSSTTPGTAFTSGSYTPTTWSGTDINRPVTEITKTTDYVSFKLMGGVAADNKIVVGVIENSLAFPAISVGKSKSKSINIKTTGITGDLTAAVTGTNASYFTITSTSISQATANSTGYDLVVTYTPQATGTHNAVLTISGGGLLSPKVINLSGTAQ